MSTELQKEPSFEVCLRCAEPNPEGTSRCQKCKAPLDPSASTHPWEMKTANHHAYSDPANPRTKPIVFWGVWLYFGPSAIFAIHLVYTYVTSHLEDDPFFEFTFETFMALCLPVGYGVLSIWALWSVTKGYLAGKPQAE